eukprot:12083300-Ditylum_brightwellii.AAC.1
MTRATLLVKDEKDLRGVVSRIREEFPSIHGNSFKGPSKIGVNKFVHQVLEMKTIPETKIIPYRFKHNSSQNGVDSPLLYNLNFFDGIPEYHQVGCTEMFVAFELQIGLEAEVNGLREDHLAYEEGRILKAQPLLKAFKEQTRENLNDVDKVTFLPSCLT